MILAPGKIEYDLPVFDRVEEVVIKINRYKPGVKLEIITAAALKRGLALQDRAIGTMQGKPTQVAFEDHKVFFNQRPDRAYIVDILAWHLVTL